MNSIQSEMLEKLNWGPEVGVSCTWKSEEFKDGIRFGLGLMDGVKGMPSPIVQRGGDRLIAWIPCDEGFEHANTWKSAYRSAKREAARAAFFAKYGEGPDESYLSQ